MTETRRRQLLAIANKKIRDVRSIIKTIRISPPGMITPSVFMDLEQSIGEVQEGIDTIRRYNRAWKEGPRK